MFERQVPGFVRRRPIGSLALYLATTLLAICTTAASAGLLPTQLRCEYRNNPVGMDVARPRLSWTLEALPTAARGLTQSAYQVLVASSPEKLAQQQGDLWDSRKVTSDQQNQVEFAGRPLTSRLRCYWKVRVWDQNDQPSDWSEPATWIMGLLHPSDWSAKCIADPNCATNAAARGPLNGYHSEIAASEDTA